MTTRSEIPGRGSIRRGMPNRAVCRVRSTRRISSRITRSMLSAIPGRRCAGSLLLRHAPGVAIPGSLRVTAECR